MNNLQKNHNNPETRTFKAKQKRQAAYDFIRDHIQQNGYAPSRDEVAQYVGFKEGTFIHRMTATLQRQGLIEVGQDGYLMPVPDHNDLKVKEAITYYFEQAGYPPTFEEVQTRAHLDTDKVTYALRLLQLKRIVRWDETKPRGIHLRKNIPVIKQWFDTASRAAARQERIDALKVELPAPTPANIIALPSMTGLHTPAIPKLTSNQVYSIVSTNIEYHTAAIEDIAGSCADYAANILKVRHDDPQRADIFECAIRALVQHAASLIGASAYLVWSDEQPDGQAEGTNERKVKVA